MPWEQPPRPAKVWTYADEPLADVWLVCEEGHGTRPRIHQNEHEVILDADPECWEALADALRAMAKDYREGAGGE